MDDPEFQGMIRTMTANPQMMGAFLQDKRMQLVRVASDPNIECV